MFFTVPLFRHLSDSFRPVKAALGKLKRYPKIQMRNRSGRRGVFLFTLAVFILLGNGNSALWAQKNSGRNGGDGVPNFSTDMKLSPPIYSSRIYYEGSETLGRVGNELILKRDIFHQLKKYAYLEFLKQRDAAPEGEKERFNDEYFQAMRQEFLSNPNIYSQVLQDYICQLLFYCDYVISRSKEELDNQKKTLNKTFDDEYLSHLLEQMKCENMDELEEVFKTKIESSLDEERHIFIRQTLGSSWLEYNLGADTWKPTSTDLRRYYEGHLDRFEVQEKVRWQKMAVYFSNHPDKRSALDKIVYMGNAVQKAKSSQEEENLFSRVAQADSEDLFASKGGYCDWTERGEINSHVIEEALFNDELPVGAMSRIIEDSRGYSILRVIERQKKEVRPFFQVQEEVAKMIKKDRNDALKKKYEETLGKRFAVEIYKITPEERQNYLDAVSRETQSATGRDASENPY